MHRLRPLPSALAAAALCAVLQGAILPKVEPDAGWLPCVAILQGLTLPIALLGGLLIGLSAPATALRQRGSAAGALFGLGLYLAPTLAALAPGLPFPATAWLALTAWILATAVWVRRTPPEGEPRGAGHLTWGILALSLLAGVLGVVLPGPRPEIGRVPGAREPGLPAPDPGRPNLVLVVLDTLRADRVGCYGCPRGTTPFLDDLAARGLRFERAVAPASHTPPTHASLFTGLLPSEHGVMGTSVRMPPGEDTLAARLADAGYASLGVAANFVIRRDKGFARGFHLYDDSLVCHQGLGAAVVAVLRRAAVGRLLADLPVGRHTPSKILLHLFRPPEGRADAAAVTDLCLEHAGAAAATGRPFFLFANYMDVHSPYQAPGDFLDRFLEHDPGRFRERMAGLAFQRTLRQAVEDLQRDDPAAAEEIAALSDRYDGELLYLDGHLKRLVEGLEALSGDRELLVLVTSDHGEHFGEHGLVGHGEAIWEVTQHVPLVVAGTGIGAGVVDRETSLLELPATLLARAGLDPALGRSRPLPEVVGVAGAEGGAAAPPAAERGDPRTRLLYPPLAEVAVYGGGRKAFLRVDQENGTLLPGPVFDLRSDPGEASPLPPAEGPVDPSWRDAWWAAYQEGRRHSVESPADPGESAGLAQLGYAGAREEEQEEEPDRR